MARLLHYGPTGDADNATAYSNAESNTGRPEDYSLHYRIMGAAATDLRYDVSGSGASGSSPSFVSTYRRFFVRFWNLPAVETTFWYLSGTIEGGTEILHLTIDTGGVIRIYNRGSAAWPGELLVTYNAGILGTITLLQWHEFSLTCVCETVVARDCSAIGCGMGTAQLDGGPLTGGPSRVGTAVVAHQGIGVIQQIFRDVLGRLEVTSPSLDVDYSNVVVDSAALPGASRISSVKVAGLGTFQEWTAAGIADWRARNTWPGITSSLAGAITGIRTDTAGQKQTYLLESFAAAGISGSILSAVAHISFVSAPATAPTLIVIRNGVETDILTWVQSTAYLRYRLDITGWALSDTIELGILSSVGTTKIGAIVLSVEHDTALPPITIGEIETQRVSWVGNGTAQTVTLPFSPQWIWDWPRSAGRSGGFWAATANVHQRVSSPGTGDPNFIVRDTSLYLIDGAANGCNESGVQYDALVIKDPKMRMVCGGAYAEPNSAARDNYVVPLVDPFGAPFAPLALLAVLEQTNTSSLIRYSGPGFVGDSSASLTVGVAPAADYIQALTATGFTAGASLNAEQQQTSFVGFRRSAFTSTFLMDTGAYVGNGSSPRVIPVSLSGLTVAWAIVVPVSADSRAIRNDQQAAAKLLSTGGGTYSNSIEALGVDSITVGSALNTVGTVYSFLVFGYGVDAPPPTEGDACVVTLTMGSDSGGGTACLAELAIGLDSVSNNDPDPPPVVVLVAVPDVVG